MPAGGNPTKGKKLPDRAASSHPKHAKRTQWHIESARRREIRVREQQYRTLVNSQLHSGAIKIHPVTGTSRTPWEQACFERSQRRIAA